MVLANKIFKDEAENLKDIGNWQQFELFARGELSDNTLLYFVLAWIQDTFL